MSILVCPTGRCTGVRIRDRGQRKYVTYYRKFETINLSATSFTDEDMDRFNTEANKPNDVFELSIDNITSFHTNMFRYVGRVTEYPEQELPIDPYIFGLWLGDGNSANFGLTTIDRDIKDQWCTYLIRQGYNVRIVTQVRKTTIKNNELEYTETLYPTKNNKRLQIHKLLKDMNLIQNKHIPSQYIFNSVSTRLEVLAGLIDTDGSLQCGTYEIIQKNEKLSHDIINLCRSLGFFAHMKKCEKACTNSKNHRGYYWRITIHLNIFTPYIPCKLQRKQCPMHILSRRAKYLPKFTLKGEPVIRSCTNWTLAKKICLLEAVPRFIYTNRDNKQIIQWGKIKNAVKEFSEISTESMETIWHKELKHLKIQHPTLL